jgi:eukaryotic-like serine/threonine-protein kinase
MDKEAMTPERWQSIEKLFYAALERAPEERAAFVAEVCVGDDELRREVESLLSTHEHGGDFLEAAASDLAAEWIQKQQSQHQHSQVLGHFRLLTELGKGGMGEVWLAEDLRLRRKVALKLLPPEFTSQEDRLRRFEREAHAASALNHPNIITIYEIDQADGAHFIATELVEGRTLRDLLREGPMESANALDAAVQVAGALEAAHAAGIIHRDIKPENVMLRTDGLVKVLDFGLAKLVKQQSAAVDTAASAALKTETTPGMVMGTVTYMSPEQVRGETLDARSDIFSFGVMLYEMASGRQPFVGQSTAETISAILTREPPRITEFSQGIHAGLQSIVEKALAKDKEKRYQTISELLGDLKGLKEGLERVQAKPLLWQIRRPGVAVPLVVILLALGVAVTWFLNRNAKVRWAREQTLPVIESLSEQERYWEAFALAEQAEKFISGDPALMKLWPVVSRTVSIQTAPPGAAVYTKEYSDQEGAWKYLGQSPLNDIKFPRGLLRWRVEKKGYATVEGMGMADDPISLFTLTLDKENDVPSGMVRVLGKDPLRLDLAGLTTDDLKPVQLADYWIDKYEVTNKQFKEFVDRGGYHKREYWKEPFIKEGRAISWEGAMAEFLDATGRPGPALWEQGDYPQGQDHYPVTGISWYEAAAYAEFAGKSLPTLYHWYNAAAAGSAYWLSPPIIAFSNFGSRGPTQVGTHQGLGPYNTYDMAGNVKEWCWNKTDDNRRYVLGGAWDEPAYMFIYPDAQLSLSRSVRFGFRCVKYISGEPISKELTSPIQSIFRDYNEEKPVSDDLYRIYRSFYSYDKTALNATTESIDETNEHWRKEKITFNSAYGDDRVIAYLFLPRKSAPPYQTIAYFPGAYAVYSRTSNNLHPQDLNQIDYIIKSGRAVLFPVYKGTFERGGDLKSDVPNMSVSYRDYLISWSKDLRRSIDYLQTRADIKHDKIAYYGFSWGAVVGPMITTLEARIKVSILVAGGLYFEKALPEVDMINFLPRVTMPVLMVNGRDDFFYPVETSQAPMFQLLGTPQEQKRRVILDSGHMPLRNELIKEVLDWLDRYLGPA